MTRTPDFYVYKLVVDNGGAPCIKGGLLSLAICKPKIRKVAREGDVVFGFGGKAYKERLIYIAKITDKKEGTNYYRARRYAGRPDCIYVPREGKAKLRPGKKYHQDGKSLHRDVGKHFESAYVLLSNDFRYFGTEGDTEYKKGYPRIAKLVERMKRGHRRYYSDDLRKELEELKDVMWERFSRRVLGKPTEADTSRCCNADVPCSIC